VATWVWNKAFWLSPEPLKTWWVFEGGETTTTNSFV